MIRQWLRRRKLRCRITTEWDGLFIGRKWCARHEIYWDEGGPCPKREVQR